MELKCSGLLHTSYVPGRTNASFPRYRQMSDVMTSRSMPSRGTKYSFWRADAGGIACVWLDLLLGLPAIVGRIWARRRRQARRNRNCWARARRLVSGWVLRRNWVRRHGWQGGGKIGRRTRMKEGGEERRERAVLEEMGRRAGPRKQPGAWGWAGKVGPRLPGQRDW